MRAAPRVAARVAAPTVAAADGVTAVWPRARWARALRSLLHTLLLFPVLRLFAGRLVVRGRETLPDGPIVVVANHASHADTAAILRALPRRLRTRLAPAAAEDYFFGSRARSVAVSLGIGAFPFPRRGRAGLARAQTLLDGKWSVLMFPEGSRDGGRFHAGAGVLAAQGATVVPAGIAGTREILAKGRTMPRFGRVAVTFGAPLQADSGRDPRAVARTLERRVRALAAASEMARPARRSAYERARGLARSRRGLALVFAWGVAEALAWPIVPDFPVAALAVAAPSRGPLLALAAAGGSVLGGAIGFAIAASGFVPATLPAVTARMQAHAGAWLVADGAGALARQPWSGIPFKTFVFAAPAAGVPVGEFLGRALLARGARLLQVAVAFGALSAIVRRWMPRLYGAFLLVYTGVFLAGWYKVLGEWR